MTELISILLFLIGLGLMHGLQKLFVPNSNDSLMRMMNIVFFFLVWNSEYVAMSIAFFAIIFYIKNDDREQLISILKNLIYVMLFAFIFRKLKDVGMQFLIEQNLQHIK
jgi:hypothetical protein